VEAIQPLLSADGSGWADQGRAWIDPDVLAAGGVGRSRWIGIFDGPGVFCVLFTMTLPIVLVRVGKENPKWVRAVAALVVLLLLVATYATGARGGFLASLAVIGLFVMVRRKVSPRTIAIVVGLAVAAYSLAPAHLTTIRDQSNSTQYRVEMWAEGLDMVKEDPVLGIGRGNFQRYTGRLIAHNSAVQMGGETGLVGLFLWMTLIYLSIRACIDFGRSATDPADKAFATGLALSVAAYLVSAMFVTLEYETFYLLLAFCAALGRAAPQPASLGLARSDLIRIGAMEVGWIIGLQVFVIMYLG
jgi:O-antigen ligase